MSAGQDGITRNVPIGLELMIADVCDLDPDQPLRWIIVCWQAGTGAGYDLRVTFNGQGSEVDVAQALLDVAVSLETPAGTS